MPQFALHLSRIVRRSSSRILASSAPNGSSISSTFGRCASARATAMRCCCPPESWVGSRSSMPSSATSFSSSLRRLRRSADCTLRTRSANSMLSATLMCRKSA